MMYGLKIHLQNAALHVSPETPFVLNFKMTRTPMEEKSQKEFFMLSQLLIL